MSAGMQQQECDNASHYLKQTPQVVLNPMPMYQGLLARFPFRVHRAGAISCGEMSEVKPDEQSAD